MTTMDDGERPGGGGWSPTTRLAGECPSPFSATCADGWDGRSDDDDDDGGGGGGGTLALHVVNRRVWPNGPTCSGDDDDDGIGSPCRRGRAGHVNRCALDVRDVIGAAHRGSPRFNAEPAVCTGTGAVSGNRTRGIPVQGLSYCWFRSHSLIWLRIRSVNRAVNSLSLIWLGLLSARHQQ